MKRFSVSLGLNSTTTFERGDFMEDSPEWPSYTIGPKESLFAIGVASAKFAELESVIEFIFGTVFGIGMNAATLIVAKIGSGTALGLMEKQLPQLEWSDDIKDRVEHFFKGIKICTDNRNQIVHSNLAWTGANQKTVLYKTSKNGNVTASAQTAEQLRACADEINTYCVFGRQLGNAIGNSSTSPPAFPASAFPLPDKCPLPRPLEFQSDSIPL